MTIALAFLASTATPAGGRALSRSDRAAIEQAMSSSRDAVAICIPGDRLAAEYATAAGCRVKFASDAVEIPAFATAWFGCGYLEHQGDEITAQLAEQRAASLVFDVLSAARLSDGNLRIMRAARARARDVIDVSGPVVLVVSEFAARPNYVSRYRRQQAKRQVVIVPAEVPVSDWQPVRPRTKRSGGSLSEGSIDERTDAAFGMTERQTSATDQPIVADPKTCAEQLVRYLAHHGFLQRGQVSPLSPEGRGAGGEGDVTDVEVGRKPDALARDGRLSSLASASGSLISVVARRPRLPDESTSRRLRQPRRVESTIPSASNISDRRPRLIGKPGNNNRGPRRIPGSPTSI